MCSDPSVNCFDTVCYVNPTQMIKKCAIYHVYCGLMSLTRCLPTLGHLHVTTQPVWQMLPIDNGEKYLFLGRTELLLHAYTFC